MSIMPLPVYIWLYKPVEWPDISGSNISMKHWKFHRKTRLANLLADPVVLGYPITKKCISHVIYRQPLSAFFGAALIQGTDPFRWCADENWQGGKRCRFEAVGVDQKDWSWKGISKSSYIYIYIYIFQYLPIWTPKCSEDKLGEHLDVNWTHHLESQKINICVWNDVFFLDWHLSLL